MDDHGAGQVVHSMFTETSVFVAPNGERFPYLHVTATLEDGTQANLLLNAQMTVFMLDAVTRYMGTVFGVAEVGKTLEMAMDEAIDWDNLPPPPEDIVDWDPNTEPDPDYRHDNPPIEGED